MKRNVLQFLYSVLSILIGVGIFVLLLHLLDLQICDIIYTLLHLICIEICLVISFVTNLLELGKKTDIDIYNKAISRKSVWLKSYIVWLVVHFWLIGSSLLATVNIMYITVDSLDQKRIVLYSILSLFFTCASYAISPITIAEGYRLAYVKLDSAILLYETDASKLDDLKNGMAEGEKMITKYTFKNDFL